MAENWVCVQCTAYNAPRRTECWQCGESRSDVGSLDATPRRKMGKVRKKRVHWLVILLGILTVTCLLLNVLWSLPLVLENPKRVAECNIESKPIVAQTTSYLLTLSDCYWEEKDALVITFFPFHFHSDINDILVLELSVTNLLAQEPRFRCDVNDEDGLWHSGSPGSDLFLLWLKPYETVEGDLRFHRIEKRAEDLKLRCYTLSRTNEKIDEQVIPLQ